jgi:cytochrome b involved in lipid metabolism
MMTVAGKDATKPFNKYHRMAILNKYRPRLLVGNLKEGEEKKSGFGKWFGKK